MLLNLDPNQQELTSDWVDNIAAFTCPECRQVFVVSAVLHKEGRLCPRCGDSIAKVEGIRALNGTALIHWVE